MEKDNSSYKINKDIQKDMIALGILFVVCECLKKIGWYGIAFLIHIGYLIMLISLFVNIIWRTTNGSK